jgi:hypothetical protein
MKTMSKTRLSSCFFVIIIFLFFLSCTEKSSQEKKEKYLQGKMEQKESVTFPELGALQIRAQAIEGQLPRLVISDTREKPLFQLEMGHSDPDAYKVHSGIEFQVRHIPGFPDPLVMVAAAGAGGSAARLEMALIGAISGEFKVLWNKAAYSDGGFFVGDLGRKRGVGIAQWLWKSSECHACEPDIYYVKLYLWNKEKAEFDVGPKFIINKDRFDDIKKLELDFPSQIEDFKRL